MDAKSKQAWVVSVDMGYGHQRAAYPFRHIARERIITANSDTVVEPAERAMWQQFQDFYETISRLGQVPGLGKWIWSIYGYFQSIFPFYPFRDLSKPNLGAIHLQKLIRKGFAASVPSYTKKEHIPFLSTFFAVAIAADQQGVPDVFCIVTDSDINRIWVATKPRASKVIYLAPSHRAQKRLQLYGVPPERIFMTGFPLPQENVLSVKNDFARRIPVLDPSGVFRSKYHKMLTSEFGPLSDQNSPLCIVFAVGGAGAQAELAHTILKSLRSSLEGGRIELHLVAGTRLEVNAQFLKAIADVDLNGQLGRSIHILCSLSKVEYFEQFNLLLRRADILWTKPSELSFFCALGIPVIMTHPLGSHEVCNRDWLQKMGAGLPQEDPSAAADWIFEWLQRGLFALAALNGFLHAPRFGTENIERLLFSPDRSSVKLRH